MPASRNSSDAGSVGSGSKYSSEGSDDGRALGETCMCLETVARWTIQHSRCVLIFWVLVSLACVPFACRFTEVLKITLDPPPGSGSAEAAKVFQEHFPANALTARYVGYVETNGVSIVDMPGINNFSRELERLLNASRPLSSYMSVTTYDDLTNPLKELGEDPPRMTVPMYSQDKTAMLFSWSTADDPAAKDTMAWAWEAHDIFTELVQKRLGDAIVYSGTNSYSQVAGQSVKVARDDLARTDLISIPLTALVLFFVIESWRMLIITGLTLGVSACLSFATTYLVGLIIPVQAVTPSLMMCLVISMSIDYSIFLLTRFREEFGERSVDPDSDLDEDLLHSAICVTMATSGATILLSGSVLLFAFMFLAFFPVSIVASMGIGSCITMIMMVVANLTLVPALLSEFPSFFTRYLMSPLPYNPLNGCSKSGGSNRQCWKALANATTKFPCNIILLVVVTLVTLAFSYPILSLRTNADMRQAMAEGSNLQVIADRITHKFGGGLAYPYEVLLVPKDPTLKVFSTEFFDKSGNLLEDVKEDVEAAVPHVRGTAYSFVSYQSGPNVSTGIVYYDILRGICEIDKFTTSLTARRLGDSAQFAKFFPMCNYLLNEFTNTADWQNVAPTAAYGLIVASGIEPLSKDGKMLYEALQKAFAKFAPKYEMTAVIGGTPAKELDMVATLYGTLPIAAVATLTTAGIFLAISFRSMLIPIRSLLSNCLTLGFVYGVQVLVYQYGWIDFLGKSGINGKYGAIPWFSPVVAFFIITGVGLDYDIFVLVRITEFRGKGKSPQAAIQDGLVSTGGIITAAGFVMVLAYSGMLFSSLVQATMFGFMMVLAVLYDTFIARCIVVPTGMSLLGYSNWWPSELAKKGSLSRTFHARSDNGELERLDFDSDVASSYVE